MADCLGVVPARYESTRFPGKMLATIAGKTLIRRTYENAAESNLFTDIIVATDDERIAQEVKSFGGKVKMTSPNHLTGSDRIAEVAADQNEKIIFNIQGDEPDVEPETFQAIISQLETDPDAVVGTAVKLIKDDEHAQDPSVVKCVMAKNGRALYFSRSPIPHTGPYYHHLGLYAFRKEFLLHYSKLDASPLQLRENLEQLKILENGFAIQVAVVNSNAHGIDTPEDLKRYEKLICKKNTSS